MNKVVMYSKDYCPYCARAKALLEQRGVDDLEIIQIDREPSQRDIMIERTGRRTVPAHYRSRVRTVLRQLWRLPAPADARPATRWDVAAVAGIAVLAVLEAVVWQPDLAWRWVSLGVFVFRMNRIGFKLDMTPYPRLAAVASHLETLPAFAAARPEVQPDAE